LKPAALYDFTRIPPGAVVVAIRTADDGMVRVVYREPSGWLVLDARRPE